MAWQFDRPEKGDGMVQAFRRGDSIYESARLRLRGLDPEATYMVRNVDTPRATEASGRATRAVRNIDTARGAKMTGRELMEQGLLIELTDRPQAAVFLYRRAK